MTHHNLVHKRIRTLLFATFALFGVIIAQLFSVQVVRAGTISERAAKELLLTSTLLAPRGAISDINGVELARSVAAITIVVDQTQIDDAKLAAKITAPILQMGEDELEALYIGTLKYKIIVKNGKPAMWSKLQNTIANYNKEVLKQKGGLSKRILGFFSERSYVREYPTGPLASSLIGFINHEGVGAAGIESSLNSELSGINGQYIYENGAGTIIPGSAKIRTEAKAGTSIRLTIDRDIQWVAQDAISKAVKSSSAKSGTVIVMDPKTGAIIAQASAPTYNPSKPIVGNLDIIRNPAVQDSYNPGSTGKVITYAAALEEKKLTPNSVYTIPYSMRVAGTPFKDHEKHPTQRLTATGALAVSSNVAAIQIGQQLGSDTLYKYLTDFGIGQYTGSHLPGETPGLLAPVSKWSGTSLPTFSFGQGYSVTALQATSVFATIANNGVRVTPTVVAGITDASGNYIPAKDQKTKQVLSTETAIEIRKMLESVVSGNGTAPTAAITGYRVAGKTGTAMRFDPNCSCYSGYTASFIGFAPADNPAYVVSVTIQEPKGIHWGGALGGPVFAKVMKFVLQSKNIAPSTTKLKAYPLTEAELAKKRECKMIRPVSDFSKSVAELSRIIGVESKFDLQFTGITSTSNKVEVGDLFVALHGANVHGATYIDEIMASGAVGVITDLKGSEIVGTKLPTIVIADPRRVLGDICSWFYGAPSSSLKIAGITGTNGKTTTTTILNQILKFAGKSTGLIGTNGIEIGPEKTLANFTTPEASELQSLFAVMQERHISHVAMEVSSHALEARRVSSTKFAMVGFTNLSQDHLDFHGDMRSYFAAKSKLFANEYSELGFINIDDAYGKELFNAEQIPVISLSRENRTAQWHFERYDLKPRGYSIAIRGTGGILIEGEINLIGDHNLDNVLMAVAMASEFEVDPLVIGNSLAELQGAAGRLESVDIGQKFIALVDYAHTPDAVTRTLATLRKSVDGRIIAVLGCGGDRDKTKRPIMGRELLAGSDVAIFTSDNPRSENPEKILEEMISGLTLGESASITLDRREAIALAVSRALPGDCVVVLGKGHEVGQEIAGKKYPFDDRIELARAIEELT